MFSGKNKNIQASFKIFVLLCLLITHSLANADLMPDPKLCHTLFNANFAAHVKVIKIEELFEAGDPKHEMAPSYKYHLNVIKLYRGSVDNNVAVISEMGKRQVTLNVGKEYILFPYKFADGNYEIWTNLGEVDQGLKYSAKWEAKIKNLLKSEASIIEGEVLFLEQEKLKLPLTITIASSDGSMKKINIDKNGKFSADVKPGVYTLIIPETLKFAADYSPDGKAMSAHQMAPMTLVGGQCAQIGLMQE